MKIQLRAAAALMFWLGIATASCGQGHSVLVRADLDHPDGYADVVSGVESRISADPRYSVTKTIVDTEIVLNIYCIDQHPGFVCSYRIVIWTPKISPITLDRKFGMSGATDAQGAADSIVDAFLKATTDDQIQSAIRLELDKVEAFCKNPANSKRCGRPD